MNLFIPRSVILLAVGLTAGCAPTLQIDYAVATGKSINGVQSFVKMVRQRGQCDVRVTGRLSPALERGFDELLVFCRDDDALNEKSVKFLGDWLQKDPFRRLFVVVHDFDQEVAYWNAVMEKHGSSLTADVARRVDAERRYSESRLQSYTGRPVVRGDHWFGLDLAKPAVRRAKSISGDASILESINAKPEEFDLYFCRRLSLPANAGVILRAGSDPLVAQIPARDGRVFVIANGSFLLNQGMVQRGNRKLAGWLAATFDDSTKLGVVLGTRVTDDDDDNERQGMLALIRVPPIHWIVAQVLAALLIFLLYRFPIFGRPVAAEDRSARRYGRHVKAAGRLLARSRQTEFARSILDRYLAQAATGSTKKAAERGNPTQRPRSDSEHDRTE